MKDVSYGEFLRLAGEHPVVVVDAWAPWCAPCKALEPVLEAEAGRRPGVPFVKVNVEQDVAFQRAFDVQNLPTVLVFQRARVRERFSGRVRLEDLQRVLNALEGA